MEITTPATSVMKAMALLDRIALEDAARQGVTLSVLAQELGLPQNTVHNLLRSLIASGYVVQSGRGVYVAGPKCAQIGRVAQCADPHIIRRVMDALHRFVNVEGEACVCSTLVNGERVTVAVVDSKHTVRVSHATIDGEQFFAKCTGRMLAACADASELRQIIARQGMPGPHWNDIHDEAHLRAELAQLREQGYSLLNDQGDDLVAVACPISNGKEPAWGTLAMYAPAYRCSEERCLQMLERLRTIAMELFREITLA